jgi:dTDP-4-amino-4,6-dideoxygalactose transaminase
VLTKRRDAFQAHMASCGIETLIHYPLPIPRQRALASTSPAACPIADRICSEVVSLPFYPSLQTDAIERVVAAVQGFAG